MAQRHTQRAKLDETTKDIWIGVILLTVFLVIFYGCTGITSKISDGIVSARFFPYLIALSGATLSALLIIINLFKKFGSIGNVANALVDQFKKFGFKDAYTQENKDAQANEETKNPNPPIRWNMIAFSLIFMTVYLLLMDILGFIVSSAVYLIAQILVLQKDRTVKRIIMVVVISIIFPVIIYLPFRYIFSLVLPLGIFR